MLKTTLTRSLRHPKLQSCPDSRRTGVQRGGTRLEERRRRRLPGSRRSEGAWLAVGFREAGRAPERTVGPSGEASVLPSGENATDPMPPGLP